MKFVPSLAPPAYEQWNESQFRADLERTLDALTIAPAADTTPDAPFDLGTKATGSTVTPLFGTSTYNKVTINGTITFAFPTGVVPGGTYILEIVIGSTPPVLTWDAGYKWPVGTAPTISTVAGKVDVITFVAPSAEALYSVHQPDFR